MPLTLIIHQISVQAGEVQSTCNIHPTSTAEKIRITVSQEVLSVKAVIQQGVFHSKMASQTAAMYAQFRCTIHMSVSTGLGFWGAY